MSTDQNILAAQYEATIVKAKARAAEYGSSVYVCATLAVKGGAPFVTGFVLSDYHNESAVCRVHVSRSGAATISEI